MLNLFVQTSKYFMLGIFVFYMLTGFYSFKIASSNPKSHTVYLLQKLMIYLFEVDGFLLLYAMERDVRYLGFLSIFTVEISAIFLIYRIFFSQGSTLLVNHWCMLLSIGMVMLSRLSLDKATRQLLFVICGAAIAFLIPVILGRGSLFRKLTWIYAGLGILGLGLVAVAGNTDYGAKLSLTIGGFTVQPSEFVKILFVFFIASMIYKDASLQRLVITGVISAVFVLLLVISNDLGGAFLFYMTFVLMVYVASHKLYYLLGGMGFLGLVGGLGYKLFPHVLRRIQAWQDPLSVYDTSGYQVSQSLFAIGSGGWFGFGLGQGKPKKIPVVEKDFIFSAISEELGGLFALCLILLCLCLFLLIMNIALQLKDRFYKLMALGLGILYGLQVFLTIGGVIKMIPSTGVTLPLISYGGSSLLSTFILLGIVQGLYIMNARNKKKEAENGQDQENQQEE